MRALHRKLLRDLWNLKGQVLAISMVIAAAVCVYLMYLGAFDSLRLTQTNYYDRYRFADVFASLTRAPQALGARIRAIPGVQQAELRVTTSVTLDMADMSEPVVARLVSIPPRHDPILNDVFIRTGRYIDATHRNEVLVNEGFALAHELVPGDSIFAVINGRRRELVIAGIALSPEFIYKIRPGDIMPDDRRYGVIWMNQRELAAALDMEGGFNDVALSLSSGASEADVIASLDRLLQRYGGLGARPRSLQTSHWFLNNELNQLQNFGTIIPIIFLAVAAFLMNVVLTRIVAVQRQQIAALKALGYSNFELGVHYYEWSLVIAVFGIGIGIAAGSWLASSLLSIYRDLFRFPVLSFEIPPDVVLVAAAVSLVSSLLGARGAVVHAVRLPPAEAMRPQAPAHYRIGFIERTLLGQRIAPATRMIFRNLSRRRLRSAFSALGIAFGAAMVIEGMFFLDAMDFAMNVQFNLAQRQDLMVSLFEPASPRALYELRHLKGVMQLEPTRSVPARLRLGHRSRQTAITGLVESPELNRVIDHNLKPVRLEQDGILLSTKMAEILGAAPGDVLTVEVLEGERPVRQVVVADVVEEFLGASVYMEINALRRLVREGRVLSGAFMQVDARDVDELYATLRKIPSVAGVSLKNAAIQSFRDSIEQNMAVIIFFNQLFSGIIAFGVIYNAARISLSERSWELASLRVLGFTKGEISYILIGEFAILTAVAVPLGLLIGYGLADLTVATVGSTELYRIPLVVAPSTFGSAALTVLVASGVSSLVVHHRLGRLDLVGVLKTGE